MRQNSIIINIKEENGKHCVELKYSKTGGKINDHMCFETNIKSHAIEYIANYLRSNMKESKKGE
jgi:hypothetical protein